MNVKRIVLDVLKPHHPNGLELSAAIAENSPGARVELRVEEVDEKTESVIISLSGEFLDYDAITDTIKSMGGTVHSIDEVVVEGNTEQDA